MDHVENRHLLVFPLPLFRELLRLMAEGAEYPVLSVGHRLHETGCDWLVRAVWRNNLLVPGALIEVLPAGSRQAPQRLRTKPAVGCLSYRIDGNGLHLRGRIDEAFGASALAALFLVGPGMHEIALEHPDG